MTKLQKLIDLCKCSVSVEINNYRDYHQTVEEALKEIDDCDFPPSISESVRQKMIEKDTLVSLQFYPTTPIGFYTIYHYDLERALDLALQALNWNEKVLPQLKRDSV